MKKSTLAKVLVAVGITPLLIGGFLHTPLGRPLLKKAACPMGGAVVSASNIERRIASSESFSTQVHLTEKHLKNNNLC